MRIFWLCEDHYRIILKVNRMCFLSWTSSPTKLLLPNVLLLLNFFLQQSSSCSRCVHIFIAMSRAPHSRRQQTLDHFMCVGDSMILGPHVNHVAAGLEAKCSCCAVLFLPKHSTKKEVSLHSKEF